MGRIDSILLTRRPALPVLGIAGIAFATTWLRSDDSNWRLILLAVSLTAVLAAAGFWVRWERGPASLVLALPAACLGLIALLRHAQGGSSSGYGALMILPVVWVALAFRRRDVVVLSLCTAATLMLPIALIGGTQYPGTSWRGAVLLTVVATVVGLVTANTVAEQRRLARLADERSRVLDRLLQTNTAIAISEPDVDHVMRTVTKEAIELTGADGAVVEMPAGDELVYRAVAGTADPFLGLSVPIQGSASGLALDTLETLVVADTETDARVDREACRRIAARSMVVVPLVHDGRAAGVLKVYASTPEALGWSEAGALGLLAHVIGAGVARAELVEMLDQHAHTDKLTGLPNRRSWDDQLVRALARADRAGEPLSVAIGDVDGLKRVNDTFGHAAGDTLIAGVAHSLRRAARTGDLVARIGGDEFGVLLTGADEATAADVVDRLVSLLPDGASVSIGVAQWDRHESARGLVERADRQMYARKGAPAQNVAS